MSSCKTHSSIDLSIPKNLFKNLKKGNQPIIQVEDEEAISMDILSILWTGFLLLALIGIGGLLLISIIVIFYLMATGQRWD
ncbi:MAG: hypothetical protein ACXAB4_09465 [Candidatus Hodarchaeales archaeon]